MEKWTDGRMHGGIDGRTHGDMDGRAHGDMEGRTHGGMDGRTYGRTGAWRHRPTDAWRHGRTDVWRHRRTDEGREILLPKSFLKSITIKGIRDFNQANKRSTKQNKKEMKRKNKERRKEQRKCDQYFIKATVSCLELDYLDNQSFTFNIFVSVLFVFSASLSIFINIFDIHFPLFFNP